MNDIKPWWWEYDQQLATDQVDKFQNGGELKNIEVSEEENVLPTGSYHKDLHQDFGIDVTRKGIPVITVDDDNVSTLEEIQEQADSVIQHAETEKMEVIFCKETTDFIEQNRKKWEETHDKDIELEVGKRITKELLFNTKDKAGIIDQIEAKV